MEITVNKGLNGHYTISILTEGVNTTVYLTRDELFQLGLQAMKMSSDLKESGE